MMRSEGRKAFNLDEEDDSLRGGMSGYLLPFQAIGVYLLVVLIGAAYLARPKVRMSSMGEAQDA